VASFRIVTLGFVVGALGVGGLAAGVYYPLRSQSGVAGSTHKGAIRETGSRGTNFPETIALPKV